MKPWACRRQPCTRILKCAPVCTCSSYLPGWLLLICGSTEQPPKCSGLRGIWPRDWRRATVVLNVVCGCLEPRPIECRHKKSQGSQQPVAHPCESATPWEFKQMTVLHSYQCPTSHCASRTMKQLQYRLAATAFFQRGARGVLATCSCSYARASTSSDKIN